MHVMHYVMALEYATAQFFLGRMERSCVWRGLIHLVFSCGKGEKGGFSKGDGEEGKLKTTSLLSGAESA